MLENVEITFNSTSDWYKVPTTNIFVLYLYKYTGQLLD